jgi:hypothetical protein
MRPVDSEAAITPVGLVPLGYPEERIDETDQDQQYCRVTDQEARDEPARPSRLVSGTSTSMGGCPCWGCGLGVSKKKK